jgi:hypothetical protein
MRAEFHLTEFFRNILESLLATRAELTAYARNNFSSGDELSPIRLNSEPFDSLLNYTYCQVYFRIPVSAVMRIYKLRRCGERLMTDQPIKGVPLD